MVDAYEFGMVPGGAVAHVFSLVAGKAHVCLSDYGATVISIEVPDRQGTVADVVLGFGSLKGYLGPNPALFGGTIGPVANRTDKAEVPLMGTVWHLEQNDGPDLANNNHTSATFGLNHRLWDAEIDDEATAVTFSLILADGELGLPGNRHLTARYALKAETGAPVTLTLDYRCESDAPTYVNVTNHTYFNLAGHDAGSVLGEVVEIFADNFLPMRPDSVPEGRVVPVEGTPFDFREPKALGSRIDSDDEQLRRGRGYDHCFCVRGYKANAAPRPALVALDEASGRALEVSLTTPGAHLYTGNYLDERMAKGGCCYVPRSGFAFEPEFYPDTIHHPDWPQTVCDPNHPWTSTIVYRFSTR